MEDNSTIKGKSSELEPDKEMKAYIALAQMAKKRKETPCPDADEAWKAFRHDNERLAINKKRFEWRMWGAAMGGAAAMLALIWIYSYFTQPEVLPEAVVAMVYDETPQNITLQENDQIVDLSDKDSVSFHHKKMPLVASTTSQAPASKRISSAQQITPRIQKLSTPRGMDFKVILPDGSEVWLNAESTIEFPAAFTGKERQVMLKGEAYFKVAHNEKAPFIVNSDKMSIRVLGTEFNFKSYAAETPHVSLIHGSVEVLRSDNKQPETRLKPGQDAWCDENGKIHVDEVDTYAVTQWVNGFFYFDGLPLVDILRELGRWYNLGVIFRNTTSMHYKMHFSASRNETIDQAIENLNRLRKVQVRIENSNLVVY